MTLRGILIKDDGNVSDFYRSFNIFCSCLNRNKHYGAQNFGYRLEEGLMYTSYCLQDLYCCTQVFAR